MTQEAPIAVELFAGAGGLGLGIERAGFHVAYATDIDKDCCETYRTNHPDTFVDCADIHTIDFKERLATLSIKEVSLLAGGPPCQGFSTVGSKNERDPRNSLFYEYLRAVSQLKPRFVLFENVSGFKRLYGGSAYRTLLSELRELGYTCASGVLDASGFGLPQRRLRTIVVGWSTTSPPLSLPEPTHSSNPSLFSAAPATPLIDAISDLPELGPGEERRSYRCKPKNTYQRTLRGTSKVLTEHSASRYGERMQQVLRMVPAGGSVMDLPEHMRPQGYFKNTYARLLPNEPSPTITRNFGTPSSSRCIHPFQNRALSTREGARIQGFPDDYQFVGGKGSKNLQIGNAVPPILGEAVARVISMSARA